MEWLVIASVLLGGERFPTAVGFILLKVPTPGVSVWREARLSGEEKNKTNSEIQPAQPPRALDIRRGKIIKLRTQLLAPLPSHPYLQQGWFLP